MLFTYTKHIIGAKTDPCGTPLITSLHSDFSCVVLSLHLFVQFFLQLMYIFCLLSPLPSGHSKYLYFSGENCIFCSILANSFLLFRLKISEPPVSCTKFSNHQSQDYRTFTVLSTLDLTDPDLTNFGFNGLRLLADNQHRSWFKYISIHSIINSLP